MRVLIYTPEMKIVNLEQLPRGTGAKYLEVIEASPHIAVQWRKEKPDKLPRGRALIKFVRRKKKSTI